MKKINEEIRQTNPVCRSKTIKYKQRYNNLRNSKLKKWFTVFFYIKITKKGKQKMKNIDKKILMTEEEIKQLQNKKKAHQSANQEERKREIDGFMKKEESLKVSFSGWILPGQDLIES